MIVGGDERAFSTSASFLVVFVGLFLALGSLYTATANTAERVGDAAEERRNHQAAVATTGVNITSATWDTTAGDLTIRATNTGDTTLTVDEADTVVDGRYVPVSDYERAEVEGESSAVWRPGEELFLEDTDTVDGFSTDPNRVKLVTATGVGATVEVSDG